MTPTWTTSCPDWEERIIAGKSLIPFPPLFPGEAEAAMQIFETLKLVDVAGQPTFGEAGRPWVMDFAKAIFGAYDPRAGKRLIRYFFLLISKKNGKSTLAAAIMLTALLLNWRKSGEFYILAPRKEVADNSFFAARDMVNADEELKDILRVTESERLITDLRSNSFLKVLAADSQIVAGKKTIGLFVDELWLFGQDIKAANMLREATGGLASRPEGFVIYASTQSDGQPAGVFETTLARFRNIRDGKLVDPRSLGVLYEFPKRFLNDDEEYRRRDLRYITNPNLGASVDEDYLDDVETKAEQDGIADIVNYCAKHLNVQVTVGGHSASWPGIEFWAMEKNIDRTLTLASLLMRCEVVVVGIDGGGSDDLLGLVVLGREKGTQRWLVWCRAWGKEIVLRRRKAIASFLRECDKEGSLKIIPDASSEDLSEVADIVDECRDSGLLPDAQAIGVDVAGTALIVNELRRREYSVTGDVAGDREIIGQVTGVPQGYQSLNNTTKSSERLLAAGDIVHEGSKLMNWCVSNAKQEKHGNAVVITKAAAGIAKIDPLMAFFNAVALMLKNPEAAGRSIYDTLGAEGESEETAPDEIDMDVLKDPRHPLFHEMRERYNAKLAAQDNDEVW